MKLPSTRNTALIAAGVVLGLTALSLGAEAVGAGGGARLTASEIIVLFSATVGVVATAFQGLKALVELTQRDAPTPSATQLRADCPPAAPPEERTAALPSYPEADPPASWDGPEFDAQAPFVGPIPLRATDADIFFGREREVEELRKRLLDRGAPLLVVSGPSGAGKTSLLRAGLMPLLEAQGCIPIYTRLLTNPRSDVLYDIKRRFPEAAESTDIPQALNRVHHAQDKACRIVLIIDQFENCFHLAKDSPQWQVFWRDIGLTLRAQGRNILAQVIFSVRGDMLFALNRVDPDLWEVPPFNSVVFVDWFDAAQAAISLEKPFQRFGVTLPHELVQTIVADLTNSDGLINPPQLQIVGAALYDLVRAKPHEEGQKEVRLTVEDYQQLNGAHAIIGQHLQSTMRGLAESRESPAWQILLRLSGSGDKRLPVLEKELRRLAPRDFDLIMRSLLKARLVSRVMSSDTDAAYILTHDYLAKVILERPNIQSIKVVLQYLSVGLEDWTQARKAGKPPPLLDFTRYRQIYNDRAQLSALTDDQCVFLAHNALAHGEAGLDYWLERLSREGAPAVLEHIAGALTSEEPRVRTNAATAVRFAVKNAAPPGGATPFATLWSLLFGMLVDASRRKTPAERSPAAREITEGRHAAVVSAWQLRHYAARNAAPGLFIRRLRTGLHNNRQVLAAGAWSLALLSIIVAATALLWLMRQGRWESVHTPLAGPIAAVAWTADELFLITERGAAADEGATLIRYAPGGDWQIVSRNFANGIIPRMLVTTVDGHERILVSVYGMGLLATDDGGAHWGVSNTGLGSYSILALKADPTDPKTLYAGSGDRKGVFQSRDGGRTWRDISGPEMFAASVGVLYFPSGAAQLLAGTDDGRIEAYDADADTWQLVSAYGGAGGIVTLYGDTIGGERVYAGTTRGRLFRSDNAGIDWKLMQRPLNVYAILSLTVPPGQPDSVFMTAVGKGGAQVWHSGDAGATWALLPNNALARQAMAIYYLKDRLYTAGVSGLFESTNLGANWAFTQPGAPLGIATLLQASPVEQGLVYGVIGESVFVTRDGGDTWARGAALPAYQVRRIVPHPTNAEIAYAGVYLPGEWSVYRTTNAGATWQITGAPAGFAENLLSDTTALAVSSDGAATTLYAGLFGCGVFWSTNGGGTWATATGSDCAVPPNAPKQVLDLAVAPENPQILYAASDNTLVSVSRDGGRTWESGELALTGRIRELEVDTLQPGRVYVASADGLWRSDDGARTWVKTTGLGEKALATIAPDRSAAGGLFAVTVTGEILHTVDAGERWMVVRHNPEVTSISALTVLNARETLLVGNGMGGLWRFTPFSVEKR